MPLSRGDVVRVDLPAPANRGREQFGQRPAIVVQRSEDNAIHGTVVVVPITSSVQTLRFTGTFAIEPTRENGLEARSVVLVSQIRAVDKSRIREKLGVLAGESLETLNQTLRQFLGL